MRADDQSGAQPLLRVEGLTKEFGSRGLLGRNKVSRAVDDVWLEAPRGVVTGVVGESGCGKSTLARLILRLVEPTKGRVVFDGHDLGGLTPGELRRLRRRMQMVFQDPYSSLDPRFTVGEALAEPFQIQREPLGPNELAARIGALLDSVGLPRSLTDRRPHEMSGGQKQRVGIARALALEPSLLVLDEPTASLDVSIQAQIVALLLDIRQRLDLTYIFISHDLGLVRYLCDRIVVMYLGSVVEILPRPDARPRHPYTRALMDSTFAPDPARRRVVTRLSGEIPSAFNRPPGCAFSNRCVFATELCRRQRPVLAQSETHPAACHHPLG